MGGFRVHPDDLLSLAPRVRAETEPLAQASPPDVMPRTFRSLRRTTYPPRAARTTAVKKLSNGDILLDDLVGLEVVAVVLDGSAELLIGDRTDPIRLRTGRAFEVTDRGGGGRSSHSRGHHVNRYRGSTSWRHWPAPGSRADEPSPTASLWSSTLGARCTWGPTGVG